MIKFRKYVWKKVISHEKNLIKAKGRGSMHAELKAGNLIRNAKLMFLNFEMRFL